MDRQGEEPVVTSVIRAEQETTGEQRKHLPRQEVEDATIVGPNRETISKVTTSTRKRTSSVTPKTAKDLLMRPAVAEEAVEANPRHLSGMMETSHQLQGLTVQTTTSRSRSSLEIAAKMTFRIASSSRKLRTWVEAAEARIASTVRPILTSNNSVTTKELKMEHMMLLSSRMAKTVAIALAVPSSATHVTTSQRSLRRPRTLRSSGFSREEATMMLKMAKRCHSRQSRRVKSS